MSRTGSSRENRFQILTEHHQCLDHFIAEIHRQNPDTDNRLMDEDLEACPSSQESNKSTTQENPKPLSVLKVNSKI